LQVKAKGIKFLSVRLVFDPGNDTQKRLGVGGIAGILVPDRDYDFTF